MDVDKFSGLIGLAPTGVDSKMASFMSTVLGSSKPKALAELEETVNQTQPIDAIFSISLSSTGDGKVLFGGYDIESYAKSGAKESDIFWSSLPQTGDSNYWTVKSPQINIGKYEITSKTSERRVILDSGLTYAMMPKKDMIELIKILKADFNIDCEAKNMALAAKAQSGKSLENSYTAE